MGFSKKLLTIVTLLCLHDNVKCNPACGAEWCDPNFQPMPNILSLMTGYHILKGNPFTAGSAHDPGFTNFIFVPTEKDAQNRYKLVDGITTTDSKGCDLTMHTESISTVEELQKKTGKKISMGSGYTSNYEAEVSAEIKGVGVKTTIPPMIDSSFSSSKEFNENERFFTGTQGILTLNEATCATYSYRIKDYKPPPLTDDFIAAVNRLYQVRSSSSSVKQNEFDKFIDNFGTHFIDSAIMGGRMAITRRYSRDEFQRSTDSQIRKCNTDRLSISIGQTASQSTANCNKVSTSASNAMIGSFVREYVTSYGSTPMSNVYTWSQQAFDAPLPIKMSLSPILNLFTAAHMNKHNINGYKDVLRWIAPYYDRYCDNHKERLNIKSCTPKIQRGCGWNDNCSPKVQHCLNQSWRPNGYYCCTPVCNNSPCRNGGGCNDIKRSCGYTCSCKTPYMGRTCTEKYIDSKILKDQVLNQMRVHNGKSNDVFKNTLKDYLNREYPRYYFVVNAYGQAHGYHSHTMSGHCAIVFRQYGRNVVACYARKDRSPPSYTNRLKAMNAAVAAVTDKGCDAKSSYNLAIAKIRSFRYPFTLVMVVRFGNGLRTTWTGSNTMFKNFRCRNECWTSWGRRKCRAHQSSLVVMFGTP